MTRLTTPGHEALDRRLDAIDTLLEQLPYQWSRPALHIVGDSSQTVGGLSGETIAGLREIERLTEILSVFDGRATGRIANVVQLRPKEPAV